MAYADLSNQEVATQRTSIPALHGLRFIAAMCVIVAHCLGAYFPEIAPLTGGLGPMGMSLFFVLSGFVIHYNYADTVISSPAGFGKFFLARFARLYPLLLVLTAADFIFWGPFMPKEAADFAVANLPFELTMTKTWVFNVDTQHDLVGWVSGFNVGSLSWSIATEWGFYVAYPLIALLIGRMRRIVAFLALLLVAAAAISWAVREGLQPYDWHPHKIHHWLYYASPYWRVVDFLLGALAAQVFMSRPVKLPVASLFFLGTFGVAVYLEFFVLKQLGASGIVLFKSIGISPLIAMSLIVLANAPRSIPSRILGTRLLVTGGEISYSLYLAQGLVLVRIPHPPGDWTVLLPTMLLAICAVIVVAAGLYRFVERPGREAIRGLFRMQPGRQMPRTAPAPAV